MATYFVSNAGSNTAPYDTEAKAANLLSTIAALPWLSTDLVKISSTHTEANGVAVNYTFPTTQGLNILSVLFNGAGTGAQTVGANINMGALGNALSLLNGYVYIYGVSFVGGTGVSNAQDVFIGSSSANKGFKFESCTFSVPSTGASALLSFGNLASGTNLDNSIICVNCTTSNGLNRVTKINQGRIIFQNLTLAGVAPTTIWDIDQDQVAQFQVISSDLTGVAWTNMVDVSGNNTSNVLFRNCKLVAGFSVTTGAFAGPNSINVQVIDCNSGDVNYYYLSTNYRGTVLADASVYQAATDGVTPISWLMTGNANTSFTWPLMTPEICFFNATLAAMVTTVEVTNDGTTFTNAQLWQETLTKVTAGFPQGTINVTDRVADYLTAGANQTASTATWTGTGGFGAEVKQKLETTSFTPTEVGVIGVIVRLAANDNVYVSPKVLTTSGKQWQSGGFFYINESTSSSSNVFIHTE